MTKRSDKKMVEWISIALMLCGAVASAYGISMREIYATQRQVAGQEQQIKQIAKDVEFIKSFYLNRGLSGG